MRAIAGAVLVVAATAFLIRADSETFWHAPLEYIAGLGLMALGLIMVLSDLFTPATPSD